MQLSADIARSVLRIASLLGVLLVRARDLAPEAQSRALDDLAGEQGALVFLAGLEQALGKVGGAADWLTSLLREQQRHSADAAGIPAGPHTVDVRPATAHAGGSADKSKSKAGKAGKARSKARSKVGKTKSKAGKAGKSKGRGKGKT